MLSMIKIDILANCQMIISVKSTSICESFTISNALLCAYSVTKVKGPSELSIGEQTTTKKTARTSTPSNTERPQRQKVGCIPAKLR